MPKDELLAIFLHIFKGFAVAVKNGSTLHWLIFSPKSQKFDSPGQTRQKRLHSSYIPVSAHGCIVSLNINIKYTFDRY
jgi:hypothetical protein